MSNDKLTNFEKVREFHQVFEHPVRTKYDPELFDKFKSLVDLRLSLITEENTELQDAVKDKNFVEVADALADILYVTYGAGLALGVDLDTAFAKVHASNMTKACNSEQEALDSIEFYKTTDKRYKDPQYKKSSDGKYWIIYDASTGKILKNKNYTPVDLTYVKN